MTAKNYFCREFNVYLYYYTFFVISKNEEKLSTISILKYKWFSIL